MTPEDRNRKRLSTRERVTQMVEERHRQREERQGGEQQRRSRDDSEPEESPEAPPMDGLFDVEDNPHLQSTVNQSSSPREEASSVSSDDDREEEEQELRVAPQGDEGPPSQIAATTLGVVDSTSSIGSYVKSSISNGSMTSPKEHIASAVKTAGDLFQHKKFVWADSELEFGGVICKKFCDKLEVQ